MSLTLKEEQSASYGRHIRLLNRIEQAEKAELPTSHDTSLPTSSLQKRAQDIKVWKEFPKQNLALQFCYYCRYSAGVFSYESEKFGTSGQRHFVVSSYHTFAHRYLDYILEENHSPHFYEVIVEGAACRLYFDIEFQKLVNPRVDGNEVLDIFIEFVCYCIWSLYGIYCDRHNILDLDSTSEKKFSHHLIFHLPNAVFQNNNEVGKFVGFICDQLRTGSFQCLQPVATDTQSKLASWKPNAAKSPLLLDMYKLVVMNDKGKSVLICDEGVYTKNRNFRLYRSSKLGKLVDLTVARENKFVSKQFELFGTNKDCYISKHINILLDSLVSYILFEDNLRILSFTHPSLQTGSAVTSCLPTKTPSVLFESGESSPFPLLDEFIRLIITRDSHPGRIRRVTYLSEGKLVIFDITGYRYCMNIRRHHKSNNIMLIANLEKMTYYQKCYDPECKRVNFRSNEFPIPLHIMPAYIEPIDECFQDIDMDTIEDFDDEEFTDNEWMGIIDELEMSINNTTEPSDS